jgi:hypothetical protein
MPTQGDAAGIRDLKPQENLPSKRATPGDWSRCAAPSMGWRAAESIWSMCDGKLDVSRAIRILAG